jgi:hypothetical protein
MTFAVATGPRRGLLFGKEIEDMNVRGSNFRRAVLAAALGAVGLAGATTAQARDRYRDGGDDAVIAIGAGLVGLAIGAALADRDDRRYYDRGWYPQRRYVRVSGYDDYYYYYPNNPRRYYRDRHYNRDYRNWYGNRGYDRRERGNRYRYRDRDSYYSRGYRGDGYRYRGSDYGYRRGY